MTLLGGLLLSSMTLGALVRQLRGTMSQTELARRLKTDQTYVSQMERGEIQLPSRQILFALADEFGVSEVELLRAAGYIRPHAHGDSLTEFELAASAAIRQIAKATTEREKRYLLRQLQAVASADSGDSQQ